MESNTKNNLSSTENSDTMTLERVAELYEQMKKENELKEYCNLEKIKYRENINQYYIVIKRKQFTANSRSALINKLYEHFLGYLASTLEDAFIEWMQWRKEISTNSKTMKENLNEWKGYIQPYAIAKQRVCNITLEDLKDYLNKLTANYAIDKKRFTNILSVLNGVLNRCVERKIISHNPLNDVDRKNYRETRCKCSISDKDNYSIEERKKILNYLSDREDIYALAIQLAFYMTVRIGELLAFKYSDVCGNVLKIRRAMRGTYEMDDDLNFSRGAITNEARMKGNKEKGFRDYPLTPKALDIIERTHKLYPDNEYLFMRDNKQLLADTFNEELRRICNELNIKYRSSHQIRFTVATMMYNKKIPLTEISTLLGHSHTATTWHYIRQSAPSEETQDSMVELLD